MTEDNEIQDKLENFDKPSIALQIPLQKSNTFYLENEKQKFIDFGINLIDSLKLDEEQVMGRPRCPYKDIIKSLLVMAFHGMSYRRAKSDIISLYETHLIDTIPKKSTLHKYMNLKETKKIVESLIQHTSLFFREHEDTLIVDSTWISKRMYTGGFKKVHDKTSATHAKCRKIHLGVLKNSHIIAVCKTSDGLTHDNKLFKDLITIPVKNGFELTTLLADKGYCSKNNYFLCESLNIKNAFIDFKSNAIPQKGKSFAWRRQLELFKEHPEIWKENYRYRVIVEGVISSIKRKCLNYLRSKKPIAMDTELLLKCLIHNLVIIGKYV